MDTGFGDQVRRYEGEKGGKGIQKIVFAFQPKTWEHFGMSVSNIQKQSFHAYVINDVLGGIFGITSRAMFSGFGLYKDGIIFGIIAENELYFKVDDSNRADYECALHETIHIPDARR